MKNETGGFKKRNELSRTEKIELLRLIASGDIDKDDINSETLFASEDDDFCVMLIGAQCISDGKEIPNIVILGRRKNPDPFAKMIKEADEYETNKSS